MRKIIQITIDGNAVINTCPCCNTVVLCTGFTEDEIRQLREKFQDARSTVKVLDILPWATHEDVVAVAYGICKTCTGSGNRLLPLADRKSPLHLVDPLEQHLKTQWDDYKQRLREPPQPKKKRRGLND